MKLAAKKLYSTSVSISLVLGIFSLDARADLPPATIQNTTIALGETSPEAFIAQGGIYRALSIIESEKSYGEKYATIVKEIKSSTYIDPENHHPFMTLAENHLADVHRKILESNKAVPQEHIILMIKKAIDDGYKTFNDEKKEGKVKIN